MKKPHSTQASGVWAPSPFGARLDVSAASSSRNAHTLQCGSFHASGYSSSAALMVDGGSKSLGLEAHRECPLLKPALNNSRAVR